MKKFQLQNDLEFCHKAVIIFCLFGAFFLYFSYLMILVKDTYIVLRTYQKCIQDDNGTPLPSR